MTQQWMDRAGAARERVSVALGAWLLLAVFVDGWAHFNRPGLETFFTPWHAALYSGLALVSGWVALLAWDRWRSGARRLAVLPGGYGATVAGVAVFSAGGLADMLWHTVFGTEVALDALVSPTHLLLGLGGVLILSTGMRTALAPDAPGGPRWTGPAVGSLVLVTALAAFFLLYLSAFAGDGPTRLFVPTPEGTAGHEEAELAVIASLGGYLVTTVLLTVPLLHLLSRGPATPLGAITLLVATVAFLTAGVVGFPPAQLAGAIGATLAAAAAETTLTVPGPRRAARTNRGRPVVVAGIITAVWAGQLTGLAVTAGLAWPVSLWFGVIVLSAALAAVLAVLRSSGQPLPLATPGT